MYNAHPQLTRLSEQLVKTCLARRHHQVFNVNNDIAACDGYASLVGNDGLFSFQVKCNTRIAYPDTYALKVKKRDRYQIFTQDSGCPMVLFVVNVPHQMIYRQDMVQLRKPYVVVINGKRKKFPVVLQLRDLKSGMQSNIEYHMGQFEAYCKLSMEEVAALTLAAK